MGAPGACGQQGRAGKARRGRGEGRESAPGCRGRGRMNAIDLHGRVALLTGGCGGIGRAIGERFRASGAAVMTWDIADAADERVDVTDEAAVGAGMERLLARRGRLDILVNCAGITGPTKRIEDCSLAEWRRTLEINLTSTFLCCR